MGSLFKDPGSFGLVSDKYVPKTITPLLRGAARQIPLAVTLLLLLAALVNFIGLAFGSLPGWLAILLDRMSSISAVFLGIFIEAAPFLLIGTLVSGLVEVFVDREELARWIPRQPLLGALAGGLLGLFFPVCECGVVPFTRRLIRKGVPVSVGVATLLAAPVLNPIVIASTLAAFGPGFIFWSRMGLSLGIAVVAGLVFSLHGDPRSLLRAAAVPAAPVHHELRTAPTIVQAPEKAPFSQRLRQALIISVDEFFEMGRFLIMGALLAALMQTFVRQSDLLAVGQGPVLSVLVMTLLAVLLSICSTVDAFIALAFTGTFTSGGILAFLVYGPMVDIKSTLMFLRVFKPRVVLYLVLLPLVMTLVATVLINLFLQG